MINRIDIQLFIASLHHISAELKAIPSVEIPDSVYAELSAIENVLMRDYLKNEQKTNA